MHFSTKYGHFSQDGYEYVITRPDTPKPWVNVISNGEYGLILSQAGGGFSWLKHSNFNRLTRWNQDMVTDPWGRFIYLRDQATHAVWSAAYQPVKNPQGTYLCRHGLGYSIFTTRCHDIESEWTQFATLTDPAEVWMLRLRNLTARARDLDLFTYLEWCLGFAPDNHREFHKTFIETEFDADARILYARKRLWEMPDEKGRHWNVEWPHTAFFAANAPVHSFDGDKETFVGSYGDLALPCAVRQGGCNNSQGKWGDGMAGLHLKVSLAAGDETGIIFILGAADNRGHAESLIEKYRPATTSQYELERVQQSWRERLKPLRVETPDPSFDLLTNIWLKYQTISCRLWGRAAYYQQSGAYGFRDQLQDSQIFLPLNPEWTAKQIRLHAAHQFQDGSVYHWWHPYTETGLHNAVSDNLLWMPYLIAEYLKETADWNFIHETIPFVDDPRPAPLWEHCRRALQRSLSWRSERGLPLIGAHDWNDGLNALGTEMKGESIWMGHFLHKILKEWETISAKAALAEAFAFCAPEADKIRDAVNRHGWDGAWYWRATRDNGEKIGSAACTEGKIYLNAQVWSVIGGTATPQRAAQAMAGVEKYLDQQYGPILFSPAYSSVDPDIGYLSRYAPGRRENGGVYTHAATWALWAETMMGRGDRAYAMYKKFNPIERGMEPDLYHVEPYVTPGNVDGPESPQFGRGGWTWYTGSAAWLFHVSINGILGIQATHAGLRLAPCIPKNWPGFKITRRFRDAIYHIEVKNPQGVESGIASVEVDGKALLRDDAGAPWILPLFPAGSCHEVRVEMGK